jgi:hypothetical protein
MENDVRTQLRDQLLSRAATSPTGPVDRQYFASLRRRAQQAKPAVRPTPSG